MPNSIIYQSAERRAAEIKFGVGTILSYLGCLSTALTTCGLLTGDLYILATKFGLLQNLPKTSPEVEWVVIGSHLAIVLLAFGTAKISDWTTKYGKRTNDGRLNAVISFQEEVPSVADRTPADHAPYN